MLKMMDRNEDYLLVYSEDEEEVNFIKEKTKATLELVYEGCPAIIVRKEKGRAV